MPANPYCLYNMRLYTRSTVLTEHAVDVSEGTIQAVEAYSGKRRSVTGRNLHGAILSPGLIDLCCRVDGDTSDLWGRIDAARRVSLQFGVTDLGLICSAIDAVQLLADNGIARLASGAGACVLGLRVEIDGTEPNATLDALMAVLEGSHDAVIEIRCGPKIAASASAFAAAAGAHLCVVVPDGEMKEVHDLAQPIACLSVSQDDLSQIPEGLAEWTEVRLPLSRDLDTTTPREIITGNAGRVLLGNHRVADLRPIGNLADQLRREIYYATLNELEYMPVGNAVLYCNRVCGVPLNSGIALATETAALYARRGDDLGQIATGYRAHLSVLNRKLTPLSASID